MLKAINPKNQSIVNRALKHLAKYDLMNDARDKAYGEGDAIAHRKYDKACEAAFEKYFEAMHSLPKGQQKAIEKHLRFGCPLMISTKIMEQA